ncbi:hypothetical protein SpCBS45565_g03134 [Spizellomyces sp. 'palustris']|nr:hypothetical protein SpCBS45565_g03134 [Spizellomyces sp. 'palustris']
MDGSRNDPGAGGGSGGKGEKSGRSKSPDVPGLEVLLQNVIAERNALRLQNDQLWKIIEKQRIIIAQLQSQVVNGTAAGSDAALGGEGMSFSDATAAFTGISNQPSAPSHPPPQGVSVSPRKGSGAPRDRSTSERPPVNSREEAEHMNRKRTVSEGREPPSRRRSTAERENINLPAITVQTPSRKHAPGSASSHSHTQPSAGSRQRSASTSSQKGPTILPPVQGAAPGGLQRKPSGSSITAPGSGVIGSGSNLGFHEHNAEESGSSRSTLQSSITSDPGSTALGEAGARNRSNGSARNDRRSRIPQQRSSTDLEEGLGESVDQGRLSTKSTDGRRKAMRPVSGRGRLEDLNEREDSAGRDHGGARPYPGLTPAEDIPTQGALGHGLSTDASRTNLESLPSAGTVYNSSGLPPEVLSHIGDREDSLDRPNKKLPAAPRPVAPRVRALQQNETSPPVSGPTLSTIPDSPSGTLQGPSASNRKDNLHPQEQLSAKRGQLGSDMSISMNSHDDDSSHAMRRGSKDGAIDSLLKSADQVNVQVTGSQIKVNDKGREVISFLISVRDAATGGELWRVEKVYSDFLALDTKLKANQGKALVTKIGKLPDKAMFTTHAPSKSDQRKVALELYLQNVKSICRDNRDILQFLSTDVDSGKKSSKTANSKEGYLFKKGKNFGAWKSRYFVLKEGGMLEYYESPKDRSLLGTIKLKYVFVSRQSSAHPFDNPSNGENGGEGTTSDTDYRHAFMLTEYKKSSFSSDNRDKPDAFSESKITARHILCAENDEERDDWVRCIAAQIKSIRPDEGFARSNTVQSSKKTNGADHVENERDHRSEKESRSRGDERAGSPAKEEALDDAPMEVEDPQSQAQAALSSSPPSVGRPAPEIPDQSVPEGEGSPIAPARTASISMVMGGNNPLMQSAQNSPSSTVKPRGRSYVDDNERVMMQPEPPPLVGVEEQERRLREAAGAGPGSGGKDKRDDRKNRRITTFNWGKKKQSEGLSRAADPSRRVFGVPLEQAVAVSRVRDDMSLPAVVYRCIEYLDAKRANEEEGIYRLSGSSSVIQSLKQAFDSEGDIDLLGSSAYYDVHAISGLLKLYLRELPSPILTKQLQRDFLHVMDLADRDERITELARLVSLLPLSNYTLLRTLMAHLVRVVQKCEVNKMTVRNVGIVFSPTVGVPAGVFTLMMAEFASVFWWDGREETRGSLDAEDPSLGGTGDESPQDLTSNTVEVEQNSPPAVSEPVVEADLPIPKRRQPNSAKRRARQNAGMGLASGLSFGGLPDAGPAPTIDATGFITTVENAPLPSATVSPGSPRSPTRPVSGSKRTREEEGDHEDRGQGRGERKAVDRASFGEVVIDGEMEVEGDFDGDEVEANGGEEEEETASVAEEVVEEGDDEGKRDVRDFEAYFSDGGAEDGMWSAR